jgi:hypothetical protein
MAHLTHWHATFDMAHIQSSQPNKKQMFAESKYASMVELSSLEKELQELKHRLSLGNFRQSAGLRKRARSVGIVGEGY